MSDQERVIPLPAEAFDKTIMRGRPEHYVTAATANDDAMLIACRCGWIAIDYPNPGRLWNMWEQHRAHPEG